MDPEPSPEQSVAAIWGLLAVGIAIMAAGFLVSGVRSGKAGGGLVLFGLFFIPATITARFAFGCANAGLLVTEQTVVIRNPFRRNEVPVSELQRFIAGMQAQQFQFAPHPTPGILLEMKSGSAYPVWTLAREGFVWNSAKNVVGWEATAQELNALVYSPR